MGLNGFTASAAGLTTSKVINLAGTTGGATIYANQTGTSPVILNANFTATGGTSANAKTLTLGGTNTADNIINGIIPNNAAGGTVNLAKGGPGTWVLAGANAFTGTVTISNGVLKLKANAATSTILGGNAITFNASNVYAGGRLELVGQTGTNNVQTLGTLTVTQGANTVKLSPGAGGGTASIVFGGISIPATTAAGGSVNFDVPAGSNSITLGGATPGNILSTGLYYNGADFAFVDVGGVLRAPNYATDSDFATTTTALTSAKSNEITGGFSNGAVTIDSLKISGSQILDTTGLLTIRTAGTANGTGGILQTGGSGEIAGTGVSTGGSGSLLIRVDESGDNLTLSAPITSTTTGGFTKSGLGTLILSAANNQTGTVTINEGTVKLDGAGRLAASNVSVTMRQGATIDLNGVTPSGTTNSWNNNGTLTNTSTTPVTFTVGGSNGTGTSFGTFTEVAGKGKISIIKSGSGAQSWLGTSNYTGSTTIGSTGSVTVETLADIGVSSGIGAGDVTDNAGSLIFTGSTGGLIYAGNLRNGELVLGSTSATTDRLFTMSGTGATISSTPGTNLNNAIVWSNTGDIAYGVVGPQLLTLSGTSQGENAFNPRLIDSGGGVNITSVTKTGTGIWKLGGVGNTYSGATTITQGILFADDGVGLSPNSNLVFDGGTLQSQGSFNRDIGTGAGQMRFAAPASNTAQFSGGFLGGDSKLTVSWSGTPVWGSTSGFLDTRNGLMLNGSQARAQGATGSTAMSEVDIAGDFSLGTANGVGQGPGLSITLAQNSSTVTVASTANLAVGQAITGTNVPVGAYIVSVNSATQFTMSANTANSTGIAGTYLDGQIYASALRSIRVDDNGNSGADFATISGVISGNAGTGIRKLGGGLLTLRGANTYSGETNVFQGTLAVTSLGNSSGTGGTSVGTEVGANLDSRAITLGNGVTGAGILDYIGPGETSDRKIRLNTTTGSTQIHADGAGPLILTNVANDMVAGAKTLLLRGTNTSGNMVTSQLSDNGGTLGVQVDGGATWILTNSSNNYTGNTTAGAGALGIGSDTALGSGGTLVLSNSNVFAYGADRVIANPVQHNTNTTQGFIGDYSLTFTNGLTAAASANNIGTNNNIVAGKALTFNGLTANSMTANRAWTVDGSGLTIVDGNIMTSTTFGLVLSKTGNGTLQLNGTGSNFNQNNAALDIDRGILRAGANNVIPSSVGSGGVTLSPEIATGDTATFDLNGTSQTITALTASTDGTAIIDNTSASAASLRFGANDTAVSFGSGAGTYAIQNTGAGALDIIKLGNTTATFVTGITLGHKGITGSEGGGVFSIASPVTATTGLRAIQGSTLALSGGITAPGLITSIEVGAGSTLSLLDGAGSNINGLTTLNLGNTGTGTATLNLNVGDSATDTLTLLTGGALGLGNSITFNMTDAGLSGSTTYTLLSVPDGGLAAFGLGNFIQGATPGGFTSFTWDVQDTYVKLTTGTLITGSSYWRGLTDTSWNANVNNWATDQTGGTPSASTPGSGTDVHFQWDAPTNAAVVTTLEQNFKINSLTFEDSTVLANTPTSFTINPGAVATNRLEIAPQAATDGIKITNTNATAVTISGPVKIGANQTWGVANSGSVLSLGSLFGEADVTKSGAGKVTLTTAADPTFNAGVTADFTINGGTLEILSNAALGNTINANLANVTVNSTGAFYYNNATAGTVANPITLGGGTLSGGGATQTYSSVINVTAGSSINMADSNGNTSATARSITLSGGLSGTGDLTLTGNNAVSGGNQISGTLTLNQDNSAWSGDWNILRGTITTNNVNGLGSGDLITFEKGKIAFTGTAGTRTISQDITVASATETSVGELNFATGIAADVMGKVTLGGAGGAGELRVFMSSDTATVALKGGVELVNDGGLGSQNAATRVLTVDSVISETGGSHALTINDAAWGGTGGTVALNMANTYTGGTNLARGILRLGNKDALSTGALTVTGTSTLQPGTDLSGANALANNVVLKAGLTIAGTANLTVAGTTTQDGGDRTLTNSLTGGANLLLSQVNLAEAGSLAARNLTIAGASAGTTTISVLVNNDQNNTLTNSLTPASLTIGTIALSESSGTGRTVTLGGAGNTLVNGVIENVAGGGGSAGGLNKSGTGVLTLEGTNTFTGNVSISAGTLEYSTVSDGGGVASNLGQGFAISMAGGVLRFIGPTDQSTNRPITTTGSATLTASGTSGATITYAGSITQAANNSLTLNGAGEGFITGGITQPAGAASADITVTAGTWTIEDSNVSIADDLLLSAGSALTLQNLVLSVNDDIVNTGGTLNLNTTGLWAPTNPAGTSAGLYARGGGVINLGANDINGANNANGADFITLADGTTLGSGTLDTNGYSLTIPQFNVGAVADGFEGYALDNGTITVTATAVDWSTGIRLYRGAVEANLAGVASILKQGLGDVTLSGDNSGLTGTVAATRMDAGGLILDFSTSNTPKVSTVAALDMRGGTLTMNGSTAADSVQTVTGLVLSSGGAGSITVNAGAGKSAVLNLNAITRAVNSQDGTMRFVLPTGTQSTTNGITTDTLNTVGTGANAILGGWATVNDGSGVFFARNGTNAADGNIVAAATTLQDAVGSWATGENISDSAGFSGTLACANINSLRFNAAAGSAMNIMSGGALGIGSGGILVTDQVTSGSPGIFGGFLSSGAFASSVPELMITQDSSQTFEISSSIVVNHAVTKAGTGTLRLSGRNSYTGTTELQNGILEVSGGNAIADTGLVSLADDRAVTFRLLNSESIGRLSGGSAASGLAHLAVVEIGSNTLTTDNTAGSTTFAGTITGTGNLIKKGSNNLQLTGLSSGFTGNVVVDGGLLYMSGLGQLNAAKFTVNANGALLIDNNGTTRSGTRILDTTPITLNSATGFNGSGTLPMGLWIRTDQNATTNETVGVLTFNSGANYLSGEANVASGAAVAQLIANNFVRLNNATIDARGRAMGATTGNRNQFRIGDATNQTAFIATLVGGGGAAASKNISIVPWAIGETATANLGNTNMGNSLVTYVSGAGLRALDLATEYSTFSGATVTDNVREALSGPLSVAAGVSGITTINALVLNNASAAAAAHAVTGAGAGESLAITSGALLFTGNTAAAPGAYGINLGGFDSGITVGGTNEYVIHVVNPTAVAATPVLTATIDSPLTSAADITKAGRGTLVLTGVNTAGGGAAKTTINEGILEISDLDNIGGTTGGLVFAGGTLRLSASYSGDDLTQRTLNLLSGGGTIDTNGINLVLANSIGSGIGGFTKTGAGNLTLNGVAAYTGNTVISGGTLTLGVSGAIGTGALSITSGATLDIGSNSINVASLATAGAGSAISGSGTITSGSGFTFAHTGDTGVLAVLAGSGGVLKTQTNVVTLSGLSSYTGATEVQSGTLSFNSISNVGGGASALGNPATADAGMIRMGLTTVATTLNYTGGGHSSDRVVAMQGTTGAVTIDADGTGALGLGGVHMLIAGNKTLTLMGSSDPSLANTMGEISECGLGVLTVVKSDPSTWVLNATNDYTGSTSVNNGVLRVAATQTMTGALNFGSANTITTAGTLEVKEDASFGSMVVQTNSATNTNHLVVDSGKTLTINGNVTLGSGAGTSTTLFDATGAGTFAVNNTTASGVTFLVGNSNSNVTTADFSGLATMSVGLNPTAGILQVSSTSSTNLTGYGVLKLAIDSTITAGALTVGGGGSYGGGVGQVNQVQLGTGDTLLNVGAINIGTGSRDLGSITFQGATGTLEVRGTDGTSAVPFNMGTGAAVTAVALSGNQNTFDVTGHDADLKFSTVNIGTQNRGADLVNVFSFDQGVLDIGTLNASAKGANGFATTTTINIGGGTVTTGGWTLASTSGAGNAVATANLTGGDITFSGDIARGADSAGGGTATGNVNLSGANLDMGGNNIGSSANQINFAAESGSLSNLAELNGGGTLTKTTTGTLTLGNGNAFIGGVNVAGGTLLANNTTGSATGSGPVSVDVGATLGGDGFIAPVIHESIIVDGDLMVGMAGATTGADLALTTTGTGSTILNGKVGFDIFSGDGAGDNTAVLGAADLLVLSGPVTLGGTLAIGDPNALTAWVDGDKWKLFDWALSGAPTGTFTNLTSTVGNFTDLPDLSTYSLAWDVSDIYNGGTISIVTIPEPSRMMLLLFGFMGLVLRRRRK